MTAQAIRAESTGRSGLPSGLAGNTRPLVRTLPLPGSLLTAFTF